MRALLFTCGLLTLTGCASLPEADPSQAWIDLSAHPDATLHAEKVDDVAWTDTRYFEVQPGRHELTVRYQFPVDPTNIGPETEPLWRDCQLHLTFKDFDAGQRYQLQAGSIGFRPWAKLYDPQRKVVGEALPAGCQRT